MNQSQLLETILAEVRELKAMITATADEVFDIKQASVFLRLSISAIYEKTSSRGGEPPELPHFKRGKRLFFSKVDLAKWLLTNRVLSSAEIQQIAVDQNSRR